MHFNARRVVIADGRHISWGRDWQRPNQVLLWHISSSLIVQKGFVFMNKCCLLEQKKTNCAKTMLRAMIMNTKKQSKHKINILLISQIIHQIYLFCYFYVLSSPIMGLWKYIFILVYAYILKGNRSFCFSSLKCSRCLSTKHHTII